MIKIGDYCFGDSFLNYNGQGQITSAVWKYLLQMPLLKDQSHRHAFQQFNGGFQFFLFGLGFHAIQAEYVRSIKSSNI